MTNTYPDDAPCDQKLLEEIRCLRCVNERILRALDESLFPSYQMEKFSGSADARNSLNEITVVLTEIHNIRCETEHILEKLNSSLFVDYLMEKNKNDKVHENE